MITIEVIQEDINQGYANREKSLDYHPPSHCPVSIALQRVLKCTVYAGFRTYNSDKYTGDLPSKVTDWIRDFDNEITVSPFIFQIQE